MIDEAGQATPQAAAGAIWRSKKVLVIGDPRQIEPVVTAPEEIIARLATSYSVSDDWSPSCVSAQVLADRMCPWGTYLDRMETAWIACPLRVHRRCAEPMFRIANEIAYDNLMIQGTAECESSIEHCLGPSRWLDCRGSARSGHWIADEGALTLELLSQALLAEQPDFFVISPFRTVAEGMRACFQQQQIELLEQLAERLSSPVRDVLKQRIGTIHTFQGRQADAVILLLGGDVQRPGALAWASRRPNLLNVAITRAKRRLYVVGNRDKWRELQYFSLLADSLPSPEKENLKLANF